MTNAATTKTQGIDGGWGWLVVLSAFLIHVVADGFVNTLGILMDDLKTELHSDNTNAALVFSILNGFYMASGVFATVLIDRIGCNLTCAIGCVFSATGCFLSLWADSMLWLGVTVGVILGTGAGLMYCPAIVCVTRYFHQKRALATGITVCGAGIGSFLFSPINAFVITHFGAPAVFKLFTGLFLFSILFALTFREAPKDPAKPEAENGQLLGKQAEKREEEDGMLHWFKEALILFKNPFFLFYGLSAMLTSFGTNGPTYFLPFYAKETLKLSQEEAAMPLAVYGLLNTVGRVVCGFIGDFGENKSRNRVVLLGSSLVICGLLCCGSFLMLDFWSLAVYAGLFGFSLSASICLMSVVLVDLVGTEKLTQAFGIVLTLKGIGTLAGPSIAGFLADIAGSYHPTYIFSGLALALSGLLLIPMLGKISKAKQPEQPEQINQ
ncbi:unnamed protein product, partial [Mesorhabditis spiculigera]